MPEEKPVIVPNPRFVIVTVREPLVLTGTATESWLLNPNVRYVLNADHITPTLAPHVQTSSDLKNSGKYKPLQCHGANLNGARILVLRHRDRGLGDLLFTTGPLAWLHNVSAGTCKVDYYGMADKVQLLLGNPALSNGTPLSGPVIYDSFSNYDFHWMVDQATEYDEEADQLNVYDALFRQMGLDYRKVDAKFKRPSAFLDAQDLARFDTFRELVYGDRRLDLRTTPYAVVAPLSHGSLRSMPYQLWLEIITAIAARQPVLVLGLLTERVPASGMTVGEFYQQVNAMGPHVINLMGNMPVRSAMSIVANSSVTVALDSGLLYVAQAFRVPAVSIWGSHHPGVRLGYDPDYLDLAIWQRQNCRYSPCYAYAGFPAHKCPGGKAQGVCEVFKTVSSDDVIGKITEYQKRAAAPVLK